MNLRSRDKIAIKSAKLDTYMYIYVCMYMCVYWCSIIHIIQSAGEEKKLSSGILQYTKNTFSFTTFIVKLEYSDIKIFITIKIINYCICSFHPLTITHLFVHRIFVIYV